MNSIGYDLNHPLVSDFLIRGELAVKTACLPSFMNFQYHFFLLSEFGKEKSFEFSSKSNLSKFDCDEVLSYP
jgi:hypothetical protein